MKTKLIITAHDFGLTNSVNDGIVYALNHKNNIFSEISLLPNAPASNQAAQIAKKLDVSVDLCICLTNYKPLSSKLKTMVDDKGNFLRADTKSWDFSCIDRFDAMEIKQEIEAQWDWFVTHVGRKPSALVSQKGEHGDPKILMPFVEKAKREGVPIRTPVWKWKENYAAQAYVDEEKVSHTRSVFVGLSDWRGQLGYDLENDLDRLVADISSAPSPAELLVFAGFVDEEIMAISSLSWQRGQLLSILDNQKIVDKIRSNFKLVSYQDFS